MARSASGPEHTDPDERLAQLLDEYLMAVQTGDHVCGQARSAEILRDHPELLSLLGCLDKLDRFAPPPGPGDDFTPSPESPRSGVERTLISTPPADGHGHSARSGGGSSLFDALPVDFGGYELLEEIGRGGMGVVYKARHKTLQATVAIKMIRSSQWASQDEIRRFYQEARAAASLTHSHIVKVHDVGERSGLHYLTMDLIEGSSLSGLSRNTPIEPDRAAELLAAVARAVDYLHEKGIVHRDLKPANILLDAHGIPYVTDFGLAKVYSESDQTATGTIVGTPCYMSPEQAWGRPSEVTKLSDIYSLGAILYELLTGRPPFREDNPLDVLLKVREADPLPPSRWNRRVPGDLEQICLRCLEKDPARRYESAAELAEDLDRFRRGEPLQMPAVSVVRRLQRWVRREPGLVCRLIGLTLAIVIEHGYYLTAATTPVDHWTVMSTMAIWVAVSWVCQIVLNRGTAPAVIPFVWAGADAVLFTILVMLAAEPRELLIVGYPLLIVAAGFWVRVRLVSFMTVFCLASYALVYFFGSDTVWPRHYPFLIGGIIALVGGFVGYQVHRLRVLSRYFDRGR